MIIRNRFCLLAFSLCFAFNVAICQNENKDAKLNVVSYKVNIEPDLGAKTIKGDVIINFSVDPVRKEVTFNSGDLRVTKVIGKYVSGYGQKNNKLIISLKDSVSSETQVQIFYNGKPTRGFVVPEPGQAHTVYFTSDWMICNDVPDDKAKFEIDLLVPSDKICIASGTLVKKSPQGGKVLYSWMQDYETPPYTYGFVIGTFNHYSAKHGNISLNYYSKYYTAPELQTIFSKTSDMLDFFERRSGMPFVQNAYSQILIGDHYQEMSGFAILKDSYGKLVLSDSTETNLIGHELAHQWWGNLITCESWNHFWLNEGFATFMSAAYNEHRFGEKKYKSDIDAYAAVYQKIKDSGKDKPLVFKDWSNPTKEDRNIVYFKGAYVLHLLRMELGEQKFWNGIKSYSQKYWGRSVNTLQFQKSMEETSGQDLSKFFSRWIY